MVKDRMDLLALLRKRAEDADPSASSGQALDFLRERLRAAWITRATRG